MAKAKRPVKVEVVLRPGNLSISYAWVRIRASNGRIMLVSEAYSLKNTVRAAKNLHALIPNSILVLPKA